MLMEIIQAAHH